MVNLIGGFIVADDLAPVEKIYTERYAACEKLNKDIEKHKSAKLDADELEYVVNKKADKATDKEKNKLASLKAKADLIKNTIDADKAAIAAIDERIEALRANYRSNPDFAKHEENRDEGIDLARLSYNEVRLIRNQLQYIFQDPYSSLNPRMTVASLIGEGLMAHKFCKGNNERMQDEVIKIMEDCGLAGYFVHRFAHQFSGGQRQRIGIARSLAVNPKFVVCDEAVSALDVSIQSQILNLLQELKEKKHLTYLFITHDLSVVKYISDRIGVMYLGNLVELASSDDIFASPAHPYTKALLESIPTTDSKKDLVVLEGDIPSPVNPPKGCKFHTRCKYCTEICEHVVPEWEEIAPNHFVACHHKLV
ncbi:MAG: ATP-binding cassette domain-containing protein [Butyrivibrio sp.]|nr:ATP-binding cassette domain-containing protein [Butyrivibrio sp.]